MQKLATLMLKPPAALKLYEASGIRHIPLDTTDAVDHAIVRLLKGGWVFCSGDSQKMYFVRDASSPALVEKVRQAQDDLPIREPKQVTVTSTGEANVTLRKGDTSTHERGTTPYDRRVVESVSTRPEPELLKEWDVPAPAHVRPEPEKMSVEAWFEYQRQSRG
jgi:hypothetical protein